MRIERVRLVGGASRLTPACVGLLVCVVQGRCLDEAGMDDPAEWDYGAGSVSKRELLELRRRLRDWRSLRVRAAGGDTTVCRDALGAVGQSAAWTATNPL